jgi:hypothetical protein
MRRAIKACKHNIIVTDAPSIRHFSVVNVYVTDYPVVKVHVDELSSLRIGQHAAFCRNQAIFFNKWFMNVDGDLYTQWVIGIKYMNYI